MTENIAPGRPAPTTATMRVSVVGDERRIDVAVPIWTEVHELADLYRSETGTSAVGLLTVGGRRLDDAASMHDAGLRDGSLLIAVKSPGRRARSMPAEQTSELSLDVLRAGLSGDSRPDPPRAGEIPAGGGRRALRDEGPDTTAPPHATTHLPLAGLPAGVAVLSAGATVTALMAGTSVHFGTAIGLVLLGLLTAIVSRGTRPGHSLWLATVPLHAAGAAVLVLPDGSSTLLTVGVAALVASAIAATMRTSTPDVADDELLTWTIGAGIIALIAAVCLLAGWPSATFYACIVTASIIGVRAIPSYAVRVPDHVLLDVDRLAVTAWTARERPRRSFRGVIRQDDVTSVARRGSELVAVGTVACSVAVVAGSSALLLADLSQSRRIGTLLLCLGAAAVLVLGGRSRRDRVTRRLQRAAGTITLVATTVWWVVDLGPQWRVRFIVASLILGALSLVAARAASRGWTSMWWSRRAEVAETLAGVLVFGSLTLATGLFDWMRLLTSR